MNGAPARPLALVTGASTGIGRELARELLDEGYDVVVVADEAAIADTAAVLSRPDRVVVPVQADLATDAGIARVLAEVEAVGRPLEVAALNAGTLSYGRFHQTPLEADRRVVLVNVLAVVHLAKVLVVPMVQRGHGRLLITSSIASVAPGPLYATYAASKAFLHSFAEALRVDLDGTGVTVTSLMPGPTRTAIFARSGMTGTRLHAGPKDEPASVARQALRAMQSGDDKVVTGVRHKAFVLGARFVPDRVLARVHESLLRKRH